MQRSEEPMPGTWVALNDAAGIYATEMTWRDEEEGCINEEETKSAYEQHKSDFMRKLQPSTSLDAKKPAGASVFISSKPPAGAKPAGASVESRNNDDELAHTLHELCPKAMNVIQKTVQEIAQAACYKHAQVDAEKVQTEESHKEMDRRFKEDYNEMKSALSRFVSSLPRAIEDAWNIDKHTSPVTAVGEKRKFEAWSIPECELSDAE